jgi:Flp pilus assembly protein TadG
MKRKSATVTRSFSRGSLGSRGAAAVEFAITAPMLVVLVLGIADYGLLVADSAALEGAARAGAEVAKANPTSVTAGQLTTTLNLFPSGITPTVASVCTCVDNTWPVGATCPPGPLATPCLGKTNPFTAATDARVFEYKNVTATQSVSPIVSYGTFPSPKSVTGNTTIRFQ